MFQAEAFRADGSPVLAVKGARLSDWNGRSLSALSSSQVNTTHLATLSSVALCVVSNIPVATCMYITT